MGAVLSTQDPITTLVLAVVAVALTGFIAYYLVPGRYKWIRGKVRDAIYDHKFSPAVTSAYPSHPALEGKYEWEGNNAWEDIFSNNTDAAMRFFDSLRDEQGNMKKLLHCGKGWDNCGPLIAIGDPDLIGPYVKAPDVFQKGDLFDDVAELIFGNGMAASMGQRWKAARKTLTPLFHFEQLRSYIPVVSERARALVKDFAATKGKPINPFDIFAVQAMRAIVTLAFGDAVDAQRVSDIFLDIVASSTDVVFKRLDYGKFWAQFTPEQRKNTRLRSELQSLLLSAVHKIRDSGSLEPVDGRDDMLRRLLRAQKDPEYADVLTDQQIVYEGQTFLFAGYDTTSNLLSFCMHTLATNPDALEKAQQEIDRVIPDADMELTLDHFNQLEYTRAAITETLRLWTPAAGIFRQARQPVELAGYVFPAGTEFFVPSASTNRSRDMWGDDALDFKPERHLDKSQQHPYAFLSFGAGSRNCVGRAFAVQEVCLFLAQTLKHFTLVEENVDGRKFFARISSVFGPFDDFRVRFIPRE